MNIKKIMQSLALASVVTLFTAGAAQAVCSTSGQVEQVYSSGATTYAYISPSNFFAVPGYVYYFSTTDPELSAVLAGSVHQNITVSGGATSCPTTSSYRYGGILSYAYVG